MRVSDSSHMPAWGQVELVLRVHKIAGRPLTHIRVLRGTCSSVSNAILDVRSAARRATGRMPDENFAVPTKILYKIQ